MDKTNIEKALDAVKLVAEAVAAMTDEDWGDETRGLPSGASVADAKTLIPEAIERVQTDLEALFMNEDTAGEDDGASAEGKSAE